MKQFKTLAIALAIMVGTNTFANSEPASKNKNVENADINQILRSNFLAVNEDLFAKVVFTLDENKKIEVNSVATKNPFMRRYLTNRLEDKILKGEEWEAGKTYILPVRIQAER